MKKIRLETYYHEEADPQSVWLNGWVFVYELIGCGFESRCSHLDPRWFLQFWDVALAGMRKMMNIGNDTDIAAILSCVSFAI